MSIDESFQYAPVSSSQNEIRLLRLLPTTSGVSLSIQHVSLDSEPDYCALSYAWGDPSIPRCNITVDGRPFQIPRSLEELLIGVRDLQEVLLWADAISINQQDDAEKTNQVQMMGEIYKKAKVVLMWLGPSTHGTDVSMQWIRKLGTGLLEDGIQNLKVDELGKWSDDTDEEAKEAANNGIKGKFLEYATSFNNIMYEQDRDPFNWVFSGLFNRSWWFRVWTLQECANAQVAIFRCGSESFDFVQYHVVVHFFLLLLGWSHRRYYISAQTQKEETAIKYTFRAIKALPTVHWNIRKNRLTIPADIELSLKHLLSLSNWYDAREHVLNATDPRDRIYALLGLANDEVAKQIVPDYTISWREVYIRTARVLLAHGNVDILSLCRPGYSERDPDLPSWVPDWTSKLRPAWFPLADHDLFRASGRFRNVLPLAPSDVGHAFQLTSIPLRGVIVDYILEMGEVWHSGLAVSFNTEECFKLLENTEAFVKKSQLYDDHQKEDAIWRIPCSDLEKSNVTSKLRRATEESKRGYELLKRHTKEPENFEGKDATLLVSYMERIERLDECRPFLSCKGYVGLCPSHAQVGDANVIFVGARVPYTLQSCAKRDLTKESMQDPVSISWKVIGETIVFGAMDGELMESKDIEVEELTLV